MALDALNARVTAHSVKGLWLDRLEDVGKHSIRACAAAQALSELDLSRVDPMRLSRMVDKSERAALNCARSVSRLSGFKVAPGISVGRMLAEPSLATSIEPAIDDQDRLLELSRDVLETGRLVMRLREDSWSTYLEPAAELAADNERRVVAEHKRHQRLSKETARRRVRAQARSGYWINPDGTIESADQPLEPVDEPYRPEWDDVDGDSSGGLGLPGPRP
jgi:hypothetical protein